jgi:hypothetical protein
LAGIENLIAMKTESGWPQGLRDIAELRRQQCRSRSIGEIRACSAFAAGLNHLRGAPVAPLSARQ